MNDSYDLEFEDIDFFASFEDLKKFEYEGIEFFLPKHWLKKKQEQFRPYLETLKNSVFDFEYEQVEGRVIFKEKKDIHAKSGKHWLIFLINLRSLKNGKFYPCIKFFDADEQDANREIKNFDEVFKLGNHVYAKMKGPKKEEYSPLENKLLKIPLLNDYWNIEAENKPLFLDYTEIFFKTSHSCLESILEVDHLLDAAIASPLKTAGVCDLGGFYSFLAIENRIKKRELKDLKIVYGATLYVESEGVSRPSKLIFYPRTLNAMRNLFMVFSESWENGEFNGSPIFKWEDVEKIRKYDTFVFMPSFEGEVLNTFLLKGQGEAFDVLDKVDGLVISPLESHALFWEAPEWVLSSTKNSDPGLIKAFLKNLIKRANSVGKKIFFTNFPSSLTKEDEDILDMVLFTERKENFNQSAKYLLNKEGLKKQFDFVIEEFGEDFFDKKMGFELNEILFDIDDYKIGASDLFLPKLPDCENENEELIDLTYDGLTKKYGPNWRENFSKEILERINFELSSITKKYAVVYLASLRAIKFSESLGYPVGSRGSVGSSVVAHLIGISDVNPLPPHYLCPECFFVEFVQKKGIDCGWDLPDRVCPVCEKKLLKEGFNIQFSSFMGVKGNKVADIDLNFSGNIQKDVMAYVSDVLFPGCAYRVGTCLKMKESGIVKKISRFLGCNEAKNKNFSERASGIRKSTGKHAGGVIIIPQEHHYSEFTALNYLKGGDGEYVYTTHFEFELIHDNLLKMDLLASDSIEFLYLLEKMTSVSHSKIDYFSKEVLEMFLSKDTFGINEFTTENAIKMIDEISPTKWQHLCSMSGLQHGTGVWESNAREILKKGQATIDQIDGCRDDIVMKLTGYIGSFEDAYNIVESVRKGRGVPKEYQEEAKKKVPAWYYSFVDKIQYMFPKAHAAAYLIISAKQAWYKKHYPAHFYCAYLSMKMRRNKLVKDSWLFASVEALDEEIQMLLKKKSEKNAINKTEKEKKIIICNVMKEMKKRGFEILLPHPNISLGTEFCVYEGKILPPLSIIPAIGFLVAERIVEERNTNGKFESMMDFYSRTEAPHNSMIKISSYGNFGVWSDDDKKTGDFLRKNLRDSRKRSKMNKLMKYNDVKILKEKKNAEKN